MHVHSLIAVFFIGALAAQAPISFVVPAGFATQDAPSQAWIPGAQKNLRQQTLVGSNHLGAALNHSISAIEFRRSAVDEALPAGAADLTVTLSITALDPLDCSPFYAANVGANPVQVFQGTVNVPASPAAVGPSVPWTPDNVIRIAFAQPFLYTGGTLCIDITGTIIAGQIASWWLADAALDPATGVVAELGPGCGQYTNALGQWSYVSPRSLLPGSIAKMDAYGPVGDVAVAVIGEPGPPVPLALLGLGQVGCNAYLQSALWLQITQFTSLGDPMLAQRGGLAQFPFLIPNQPWVLGGQLATQWLDASNLTSSNGVLWTVATQAPTLDMAHVDGVANDITGHVATFKAHVLRFECQ